KKKQQIARWLHAEISNPRAYGGPRETGLLWHCWPGGDRRIDLWRDVGHIQAERAVPQSVQQPRVDRGQSDHRCAANPDPESDDPEYDPHRPAAAHDDAIAERADS